MSIFVETKTRWNMKTILYTIVATLALLAGGTTAMANNPIAVFNSSNFSGWSYNRTGSDYQLTTSNIANGKIRFFVSSSGVVYALTSPEIDLSGMKSVRVKFNWKTPLYESSHFVLSHVNPVLTLIDNNGNTISSHEVSLASPTQEIEIDTDWNIEGIGKCRLTLSAPHTETNYDYAITQHIDVYCYETAGTAFAKEPSTRIAAVNGEIVVSGVPDGSSIGIYSLVGTLVAHAEGSNAAFHLPKGIYIVRIGSKATKITVK